MKNQSGIIEEIYCLLFIDGELQNDKVVFKKPLKDTQDDSSKAKKKKSKMKKVKNTNLLSFDDDEEEDT